MRRVFLGRKAAAAAVSSYIGVPGQEEAMRSVKPKLTTRGVLLSPALFALALLPRLAAAQEFEDVQPSTGILALKQQGSFFIGGHAHAVPDPYAGVGAGARPGNSMINQMYVQFQKPARSNNLPPIVFVHGCCLSSKTWETTPDGRMGWYEYFTRKGFDTYMADQVGRARSGFDALHYQVVRYDTEAPEFSDDGNGVSCVNGPSPPGPNPAGCLIPGDPRGNPVFPALPGKTGTTNPSVLIATDMFAWNVFRYGPPCTAPCGAFTSPPTIAPWPDEQFPMLIIEGDHYTTGNPPVPQARPVSPCPEEIAAIRAADGDITYVHLPEVPAIGTGNSHMFMQDHNNLKIADLIIDWIKHHVRARRED